MAETLVEMAADIVAAQAGQTAMTPDEIAEALNKTYDALKSVKAKEERLAEEPAIEKEKVEGKASIQRLCSGETKLRFGLWFTASPKVREEFANVIDKKCGDGEISEFRAKQIKTTASDMFCRFFHVRGDQKSPGLPGNDVSVEELLERHELKLGRDDWDMEHLACIVNYLRFLGGESKVQVVTSDGDFAKVLEREGYAVINPQTDTIESLRRRWSRM